MSEADRRTDGELLAAFMARRDEAAFETLVRRHGGTVFRACRALLGHAQDAEDATQAVFVVLARSAATLTPRANLGPWLHRVATHVSLDACRLRRSREARERKAAAMGETIASQAGPQPADQAALLHEELEKLPAKQRESLVLFHLQGASVGETAKALGSPEGSVKVWLARGREGLRGQLARRGVVLSAGAVATLLSAEGGAAVLPASLVAASVKAAAVALGGHAVAAGAMSHQAALLAEGVVKTMFYAKLKWTAAALLAVSAVGSGTGIALWHASADVPKGKTAPAAPPAVVPQPPAETPLGSMPGPSGPLKRDEPSSYLPAGAKITLTDGQYLFYVDPNNSKKLVCLGLMGSKKGNELWKAELSKAIEKLECALPNSMIKVWPAQTVLDMSNGKILGEDTIRQRVEEREAVMEAMRNAEREAMRKANTNLPDKK